MILCLCRYMFTGSPSRTALVVGKTVPGNKLRFAEKLNENVSVNGIDRFRF